MRNLEKQAFILGVAAAVESEIFARVWAKTEKQDPQNFGISSELPACCLGASHSRSPPAFHSGLLKDACGRWCEVGKVSARSPNLTPYAERFVRSVKESRLERRLSSRNRCAKRLLGRPAQLLLSSRGVTIVSRREASTVSHSDAELQQSMQPDTLESWPDSFLCPITLLGMSLIQARAPQFAEESTARS